MNDMQNRYPVTFTGFDGIAYRATAFSDRLHKTKREKMMAESRAQVWQQAAQMLRKYGSGE